MIGIVIAMDSEAKILLELANIKKETIVNGKKIYEGDFRGKSFVLAVCGVGKVNAAYTTSLLLHRYSVKKVLNFGVAGGLNDGTTLCSVYEIAQSVQFDFDLTQLNGTAIGTLDEYKENYLPVNALLLFPKRNLATADRFNDSRDDYLLLTEELKADIRDMEGCAIVQACLCASMPVYLFKAISDVAGSGSTTDQYLQNRDTALSNLQAELPRIFDML